MKLFKIISNFFKSPKARFGYLSKIGLYNKLSDEEFLKKEYKCNIRCELNLENPKTFNEKLQWLKLNDRKEIYTIMVDKYEVKKYIAAIIGEKYIIPTIGIYNKFKDIDFEKLPNQFVIKCTHDSGGICICKNKHTFNRKKAKKKINKFMKRNFYREHREWPYKNVKPRIIIEKYMEDENQKELIDYKMFCFNGKVRFTLVCTGRFSQKNMYKSFYDENWNCMPLTENNHPVDQNIKPPISYNEMKKIAEKLSKNHPFLRVDFYEINKKPYFGELTFFPSAGYEKFYPEKYNEIFGEWINLNLTNKQENDL